MCIPEGVLDMFMACEVANLYRYVFYYFRILFFMSDISENNIM